MSHIQVKTEAQGLCHTHKYSPPFLEEAIVYSLCDFEQAQKSYDSKVLILELQNMVERYKMFNVEVIQIA